MIKIEKDISKVPNSLQVPLKEFFTGNIPRPAKTTHTRRLELISAGKYIEKIIYSSRYKQKDTQTELKNLYKNKCAFCEQKVEQSHVEHYRPKHTYYWLTYSWDNLLLACSTCNIKKGVHFDLIGSKVTYQDSAENRKKINVNSGEYDKIEKPKMVNPEVTNPKGKIKFRRNGIIESDDTRFAYTIEKCEIDRKTLNDDRRKILEVFERDIRSAIIDNATTEKQETVIESIILKFLRDTKDPEFQFLGFRHYAISNKWLNQITKEVKAN